MFVKAAENHLAGGRLMNRCDDNVHGLVDEAACAIHDYHGAILKIGHSLVYFLAFTENEDTHAFAGKKRGPDGVGQKIYIEDADALNTGYFVEVEIIGDNLGAEAQSNFDEFTIHFVRSIGIVFDNADFKVWHFLNALQHLRPRRPR